MSRKTIMQSEFPRDSLKERVQGWFLPWICDDETVIWTALYQPHLMLLVFQSRFHATALRERERERWTAGDCGGWSPSLSSALTPALSECWILLYKELFPSLWSLTVSSCVSVNCAVLLQLEPHCPSTSVRLISRFPCCFLSYSECSRFFMSNCIGDA